MCILCREEKKVLSKEGERGRPFTQSFLQLMAGRRGKGKNHFGLERGGKNSPSTFIQSLSKQRRGTSPSKKKSLDGRHC